MRRIQIDNLAHAQISKIALNSTGESLTLLFTFGASDKSFRVELSNIVLMKYSRTPDDDGCYNVYKTELFALEDGGVEILTALGYAFKKDSNNIFSYPFTLIYFSVEGDICLDVVCKEYSITVLPSPFLV